MVLLQKNWHFSRILRALLAFWLFLEFSQTGEWVFLFPASLFALQAILDVSCCGVNGCTPMQTPHNSRAEEQNILFEEVKP